MAEETVHVNEYNGESYFNGKKSLLLDPLYIFIFIALYAKRDSVCNIGLCFQSLCVRVLSFHY